MFKISRRAGAVGEVTCLDQSCLNGIAHFFISIGCIYYTSLYYECINVSDFKVLTLTLTFVFLL